MNNTVDKMIRKITAIKYFPAPAAKYGGQTVLRVFPTHCIDYQVVASLFYQQDAVLRPH